MRRYVVSAAQSLLRTALILPIQPHNARILREATPRFQRPIQKAQILADHNIRSPRLPRCADRRDGGGVLRMGDRGCSVTYG